MTIRKKQKKHDYIAEGKASYQRWADGVVADKEGRQMYKEEAAKKELWLQLVEARLEVGLTQIEVAKRLGVSQAQVARFEKQGYDAYTLTSLRRYIKALGEGFSLQVTVKKPFEQTGHIPMSQ